MFAIGRVERGAMHRLRISLCRVSTDSYFRILYVRGTFQTSVCDDLRRDRLPELL